MAQLPSGSAVATFISAPASPEARGEEFGATHADEIADTLERYRKLFAVLAGTPVDLRPAGEEALDVIAGFSAQAEAEIRGIAGGAGLAPWEVGALNARTEILGRLSAATRGECSTVVDLRPGRRSPATAQTWDWHDRFADSWLAWTIEYPDGRVLHTVTEFGMLAKIGVNSRGVGVHVNILHHRSDGGPMGIPIHVLARGVLEHPEDVAGAVAMAGAAKVSASSVLTIIGATDSGATAVGAELAPEGPRFVLPSPDGLYIHTNHFLDPHLAAGDLAPREGPDSYLRLDVLRRALHARAAPDADELRSILSDHSAGAGSVCCHASPAAGPAGRWATLATVSLDVYAGELSVHGGGPCDTDAPRHTCRSAATTYRI